jgi:hypothetical protein
MKRFLLTVWAHLTGGLTPADKDWIRQEWEECAQSWEVTGEITGFRIEARRRAAHCRQQALRY